MRLGLGASTMKTMVGFRLVMMILEYSTDVANVVNLLVFAWCNRRDYIF